jgi:hypothetical protein
MALTDPGLGTNLLAALATSIGFGLVVGGFAAGATSFASTRSQKNAEKWSLIGGYFGGFIALMLRAVDMVMRSFV